MNEVDTLKVIIDAVASGTKQPAQAIIEAYNFGQKIGLRMAQGVFPSSGISVATVSVVGKAE